MSLTILCLLPICAFSTSMQLTVEGQYDPHLSSYGSKNFLGFKADSGAKIAIESSYRLSKTFEFLGTNYSSNDWITGLQFSWQLPIGSRVYIEPLAAIQFSNWEQFALGQSFIKQFDRQYEYGVAAGFNLGERWQIYSRGSWKTGLYKDSNGDSDKTQSYGLGISYQLNKPQTSIEQVQKPQVTIASNAFYVIETLTERPSNKQLQRTPLTGNLKHYLQATDKQMFLITGPFESEAESRYFAAQRGIKRNQKIFYLQGTLNGIRRYLSSRP